MTSHLSEWKDIHFASRIPIFVSCRGPGVWCSLKSCGLLGTEGYHLQRVVQCCLRRILEGH